MQSNAITNGLDGTICVGLTCLEEGLDSKKTVRDTILGYVGKHYIEVDEIAEPGELPVSLLDMLHRVLGVSFEVSDGVRLTPRDAQGGI